MNFVVSFINIILILFCFSNNKNVIFNNNENHNLFMTYASLNDNSVKQLFNSLESGSFDDLYINDYYEGVYFSNLHENISNNSHGTCSYVTIGMLLSYYDSYWDDSFIPEEFDIESESYFKTYSSGDFSIQSFYAESPGILFEPSNEVESLSSADYLDYVKSKSNKYFQSKLISLSISYFGASKFDNNLNQFGMTFTDITGFLGYYLYNYCNFNTSEVIIDSCNDLDSVRSYAINKIKKGIPVLLRSESSSLGGHAFITYDYDEKTDEIYVHTGWRDENANKTLSHVALSSTCFTNIIDAISLDVKMSSSISFNYRSNSGIKGSARNYIIPQDIEIVSGNYRDELPTYVWKSLYKEKWIEEYNPYFNFSILNEYSKNIFQIEEVTTKKIKISNDQWDTLLTNDENDYYAYVQLDSNVYGYFDDYFAKKMFSKPIEYDKLPQIKPNEYGFDDAYSSDETTKNNFVSHEINDDFKFETRRFRTGYIHNEYIVMSPIRNGFNEAFIEYRFNYAVNRLDVELSYWREISHEWLSSSTGEAFVQYYWDDQWVNKLDLLSPSTSLPIYRDSHKFYKIKFDNPVYRIRFYARSFKSYINENNRGRICIGNMAIYPSEYNFPLSGGELDYEPSKWNDTIIGQFLWKNEYLKEKTNCYSYAVNAQINPKSYSLEFMQPGQATGKKLNENDILDKNKILSLIKEDANKLGFVFNSIESNEKCQEDCYKVAFVIDNQYKKGDIYKYDYHWYRQNSDGTWSHKPGGTNVTKLDCDNKIIMNPLEANRNVGKGLNYNLFVGFFTIKPLNIYY